jgi:hypothetical protein
LVSRNGHQASHFDVKAGCCAGRKLNPGILQMQVAQPERRLGLRLDGDLDRLAPTVN